MAGPRLVGVSSAVILALCLALLAVDGVGQDGFRAVIRLTARTSLVLFLLAIDALAKGYPASFWTGTTMSTGVLGGERLSARPADTARA
jgi:hypothetical protein